MRDEGEAYAAKLRAAGVDITTVRYDGITHDFMMLNLLSDTHATRAAVTQAAAVLRDALRSGVALICDVRGRGQPPTSEEGGWPSGPAGRPSRRCSAGRRGGPGRSAGALPKPVGWSAL
ncbi:alpha/beta hydrolase [Streptomyces chartreusis]|uniref:alpha/beta hydrolase n=1 Tax=Streptomyces chartreusis TaxID=1969 RepID=UPI0033BC084E